MPQYKAPLRDLRFLVHDVLEAPRQYQAAGYAEATADVVDAIVQEGAKFCEELLAPCNHQGDEVGARFDNGNVVTPPGFKEAHQAYRDGQWGAIGADPAYGGQGLPQGLELIFDEMAVSANLSWRHCTGLTLGAIHAIEEHGTPEMRAQYLPKLISAEWTGTMCLTEPHAGSDVGIITTQAAPEDDGSYRITGTKIFITYGEHDLTDNIIHLVLARLPGAPVGPKGVSLFVVPKFLVNEDGSLGERNHVVCASIEHKMGIKGSPTCVLNFEDAKGWIVGPPGGGLACMFTMMNYARIDVGIQGLGQAELSFQGAVDYAKERLQMRAPTGPKAPDKAADPIIVHPDVRRMLLTQKAITEGCRALAHFTALQLDLMRHSDEKVKGEAADMLALLTPITKGILTELGFEATHLGVQVFGGHGYIRESGMEQLMRDCRITAIYEGTNTIQANDLLRRKIMGSGGGALNNLLGRIETLCGALAQDEALSGLGKSLQSVAKEWRELTMQVVKAGQGKPDEVAAAAFDYLMYSGYAVLGYLWAWMAKVAHDKRQSTDDADGFLAAKLQTAQFYFDRILPRTRALVPAIQSGADNLMTMPEGAFRF